MARQARIQSEYRHIMVRGIGKQILFEDAEDNRYYISLLKRFGDDTGVELPAYCLMENHVHLQSMERAERDEVLAKLKSKGLSVRQLERRTGINRGVIQKAK